MATVHDPVEPPIYPVPCDTIRFDYGVRRFLSETWAWSFKDLSSVIFWRDVFAEFLLCLVIMFYLGMVLITNNTTLYQPSTTHFGVFTCFIVYSMLEGWGPFGGAHLNPSATFSFMLCGRVSIAKGVLFVAAQDAGSVAGMAIAYGLTPSERKLGGNPYSAFNPAANGLTMIQACGVEGIIAFNLIFIAMSVRDPARNPPCSMPNMVIAFIKGLALLAAGTYTVGLSNPMVAFGVAAVSRDFTNHWIYWVGPFIGGPAGAFLYKIFVYMNAKFAPPHQVEKPLAPRHSSLALPMKGEKGDLALNYTGVAGVLVAVSHDELMELVESIIRRNNAAQHLSEAAA